MRNYQAIIVAGVLIAVFIGGAMQSVAQTRSIIGFGQGLLRHLDE